MTAFLARRLILSLITLVGVTFVSFLFLHLIPGDPARILAGVDASIEEIESLRDRLGLNDPLPKQYLGFISGVVRGSLGFSLRSGRPVVRELAGRIPVTLFLTVCAMTVTVLLGVPAGAISALRRKRWSLSFFLVLALSCLPVFWTGMILVLVFALKYEIMPSGGSGSPAHFVLPAAALGMSSAGLLARLLRSGLGEVMQMTYIQSARAKGLGEYAVVCKHAAKNALLPIVTVLSLQFGQLFGGAILVETLFALNGIGRYLVISIAFRDYVAVQGCVLFIAVAFITVNTVADILYGVIDPRVRYS